MVLDVETMAHIVRVSVQDLTLDVHLSQSGEDAVLLLHGFPDSRRLWKQQISALEKSGYRVIAPSLPGCGESERPAGLKGFGLPSLLLCMTQLLNHLGILQAHVVGHDWGASLAWYMAMKAPERVKKLVVLSTGHAGALFGGGGLEQRCKSWYMLWFLQEPGPVEEALAANNWQLFRELFPVDPHQQERYIAELSKPGVLTAALNLYRANIRPQSFGVTQFLPFPRLDLPVMGVWSTGDWALTEAQMKESGRYVAPGKWRYERVEGSGHWIPRDAPHKLNSLLLDFLGDGGQTEQSSPSAKL